MATTVSPTAPSPAAARRRPPWLSALIVLAVGLYALLFGELFLRTMQPESIVPRYVTGAPDGVRANMPDVAFRQWTPEVDVEVRYNDAGMRDDRPAPPLAKAPGECRVALLGDSLFVGFESGFEASFGKQLENELARRGHPCRVLNLAVSGLGHAEMLAILDSRVFPWKPDMLLVSVNGSDGLDNIRADLFRVGPGGQLQPTGKTYLPGVAISDRLQKIPLYVWAQENSHLYSAVRNWISRKGKSLLAKLAASRTADGAASPAATGDDGGEDAVDGDAPPADAGNRALNLALLQAIERAGNKAGAPVLFFEIPRIGERTVLYPVADGLIGAKARADLPFADPFAAYRRAMGPDVKLFLEQGQTHWTARGGQLAAQAAADAIVARGLLPAPPADTRSAG